MQVRILKTCKIFWGRKSQKIDYHLNLCGKRIVDEVLNDTIWQLGYCKTCRVFWGRKSQKIDHHLNLCGKSIVDEVLNDTIWQLGYYKTTFNKFLKFCWNILREKESKQTRISTLVEKYGGWDNLKRRSGQIKMRY